MTSATLSALGTFDRFRERSGIPITARWKQVASPFDASKAVFAVPAMTSLPSDSERHTAELVEMIPQLIAHDQGCFFYLPPAARWNQYWMRLKARWLIMFWFRTG